MPAIFISHSSSDNEQAAAVERFLGDEQFERRFLDFHPDRGIPGGRDWEQELYDQLRRCDGLIVLVSRAALDSHWVFAEIALARAMNKAVIPIAISDGHHHPLLDRIQAIAWPAGGRFPEAAVRTALIANSLDPASARDWSVPYVGLRALEPDDAGVFFGRTAEERDLLALLGSGTSVSGTRFLAVMGSSGSGKSSLVRAGLIGRLRKADDWAVLSAVVPGTDPYAGLGRRLAEALHPPAGLSEARQRYQAELGSAAPDEAARRLAELAADVAASRERPQAKVLLVVDQGEELLRADESRSARFLAMLAAAIEQGSPLRVVMVFRSQDLDGILGLAPPGLIRSPFVVEPLSRAGMREVIERPAVLAGLDFDPPELVDTMLDEAVGGDALPMLAYALERLWKQAGDDNVITLDEYLQIGGVNRAIAERADAIYRAHDESELVIQALLNLVAVAGLEPERRRVGQDAVPDALREVIDDFVEAHLVIADRAGEDTPTYELAHDSMLRLWPPLRDAVATNLRQLEVRTRLEPTATEWDRGGRSTGETLSWRLLGETFTALGYTGPLGTRASQWLERQRDRLGDIVTDFLGASLREELRRKRWRQVRRVAVAAVVVALVVAAGLVVQRQRLKGTARGSVAEIAAGEALIGPPDALEPATLDAFALDLHEVSNRQYRACMRAGQCTRPREPGNFEGIDAAAKLDLPVVWVDAFQAAEFCRWIGRRLPDLAEWQRVVRGTDGRSWPWGEDRPNADRVVVGFEAPFPEQPAPADGSGYEGGRSPEGSTHLIGNVREWTRTPSEECVGACPNPWGLGDRVESLAAAGFSWSDDLSVADPFLVELLFRGEPVTPTHAGFNLGFRCADSR